MLAARSAPFALAPVYLATFVSSGRKAGAMLAAVFLSAIVFCAIVLFHLSMTLFLKLNRFQESTPGLVPLDPLNLRRKIAVARAANADLLADDQRLGRAQPKAAARQVGDLDGKLAPIRIHQHGGKAGLDPRRSLFPAHDDHHRAKELNLP
jgi:hypothetical protein